MGYVSPALANALSTLKDYYFDTRYPGDNFVSVSVEELKDAIGTMLSVVKAVERWRVAHDLPIEICNVDAEFAEALERLNTNSGTSDMEVFQELVHIDKF